METLNSSNTNNQSNVHSIFTKQVLPPFYIAIFVLGLCLNVVAAWIFFRVPADSGLVVYLKNMVVADLLMLLSFPFKVVDYLGYESFDLDVIRCRYTAVLFYFSMYVGILFIGFISLERYVKVVCLSPSSSTISSSRSRFGVVSVLQHIQRATFARVLAVLTWSLLFLCCAPNVILTSNLEEKQSGKCVDLKTPLGKEWHKVSSYISVSLFWMTLVIVTFCYTSIARQVCKTYRRMRRDTIDICRKSNRSIFSILVVFFICFVPYHVCRVPFTLSQFSHSGFSSDVQFWLFQIKEGTLFLSAMNVCLDPVIYFLMCRTFRKSLLRKLSVRARRKSLTTAQSLSNI
ncbi:P2Y purinoceptor 14-like [Xiphophorus hellerii]|uniref:P2Y purinoceptor 14-like n=1 Tax=Xiphophorus hellerii TaxID=8084 RepID=UPI0013B35E96|nr:P2Y purinoceptor 14-like [Xiphophorus hellerii]XP_032446135.1 P2Y purinoceptor 14-like [Xiphophorus hellerii]